MKKRIRFEHGAAFKFAGMNLVTGATGMLGINLMIELLSRGERVRGLKRERSDLSTVRETFAHSPQGPSFDQIEWVDGDVLDTDSLLQAMHGCEYVYHCAAIVSYHSSDRAAMYKVNIDGTVNVVNAALETAIIKLCFVSSISALGKINNAWLNEESEWSESSYNSHYGITKNLSEMEVWRGIQEGMNAIIVNPGIIIGPGDYSRSSGSLFKKLNEGMDYYPPGGTGFIGVKDCVSMMVDLMQTDISGERFVLVAENKTMKDIFGEISEALEKPRPHKEATPFILKIAFMAEWLKEKFTGKKAVVTRETIRNSTARFYYENNKVQATLGRKFTPVSESILTTAAHFRKYAMPQ